ncbi:deoxyribose-phosphate aldolase [Levilactobacillus koreensis JCM 16448]|uniref:Deoxyribose-phosphate aldolase n=1 Tax=Levilactobacillus koreensis TaxID=637971 RepID=A0AAC9ERL2_9LACO|nr:deoxyribose-phosphate aldolase [Levilactobacillus koreensis]AKP65401.1 deoxyribose-phosphate aldolase [Levilactobacillus koreensis]KRK91008.1 deoxyribose-phosphate aldolase [Levilactobacillus koreensis JCM 16448]
MTLTTEQLAKYMDHTNLKADATEASIKQTCDEAAKFNTASVCVNSYWIPFVAEQLKSTTVNPIAVVGFPLGAMATASEVFEAEKAIDDGAEEIDMVINVGELKSGNNDVVEADIKALATAVHAKGKLLKVILETCLLTKDEIVRGCQLSEKAGADFVKTSTGFSTAGAKLEDVKLMRETVGDRLGVKASGGIHSREEALAMIDAGASRLGVSATVAILTGDAASAKAGY